MKSPLNIDDIKNICLFLFFSNVPLSVIIEYFNARYDVPENSQVVIEEVYINFYNL